MLNIRDRAIQEYLTALFATLGKNHLPIDEVMLRKLHGEKDYTGMVRLIQDQMLLTLRVRVGFVNKGGPPDAVAWTYHNNRTLPIYGTVAYKRTLVTFYIRKSFLEHASFESVVYAIVHELSHILLESLRNPLHSVEEAVDLTVLVLGYGRFCAIGKTYNPLLKVEIPVPKVTSLSGRIQAKWSFALERFGLKEPEKPQVINKVSRRSLGYLSRDEILYAEKLIATMRR